MNNDDDGVYEINDIDLLKCWESYTGAMVCEFWLLNSYLIILIEIGDEEGRSVITNLKCKYMREMTSNNNTLVVSSIPECRGNVKRTFIFTDWLTKHDIPKYDNVMRQSFKQLITDNPPSPSMINTHVARVSLTDVVDFLRKYKKRTLFFRSVKQQY